MRTNSSLAQALGFFSLGLNVVPVARPRRGVPAGSPGDGKVPTIAWREYQGRRASEGEIRLWFEREPQNIAVVTGAISRVVVVDSDDLEGIKFAVRRLPYTPWQTKTSRGFHLWYRYPGVRIPNRAKVLTAHGRVGLDVRGDGGFVIGPGSVHASGAIYEFAGDWTAPLASLPLFRPEWLQPPRPAVQSRRARALSADRSVAERARRYLARCPVPEISHGSDAATLSAACRLVRGFGLPQAEVEVLLWEWAGGRPGWTREWVARKVANAARYGTEAIGALV